MYNELLIIVYFEIYFHEMLTWFTMKSRISWRTVAAYRSSRRKSAI
jgi:hypothetical protein